MGIGSIIFNRLKQAAMADLLFSLMGDGALGRACEYLEALPEAQRYEAFKTLYENKDFFRRFVEKKPSDLSSVLYALSEKDRKQSIRDFILPDPRFQKFIRKNPERAYDTLLTGLSLAFDTENQAEFWKSIGRSIHADFEFYQDEEGVHNALTASFTKASFLGISAGVRVRVVDPACGFFPTLGRAWERAKDSQPYKEALLGVFARVARGEKSEYLQDPVPLWAQAKALSILKRLGIDPQSVVSGEDRERALDLSAHRIETDSARLIGQAPPEA